MKTIEELKGKIGFCQTDDVFISFLKEIAGKGIIIIRDGDLTIENGVNMVSDDFFLECCAAWGIDPDGEKPTPEEAAANAQPEEGA